MPRAPRATLSRDDLKRLYCQEHLTLMEISTRTGVPTTTLSRWRTAWGLPSVVRAESLVGHRFGRWVVLAQTSGGRRGAPTICHCRCDCGTLRDIPYGNLQQDVTRSCGCLHRLPEGQAGLNKVIGGYKRSARQRRLEYALTTDQVATLTKQPCYYCGVEPQQVRQERSARSRYVYNGLDRLDGALGYVASNVVPACWQCNRSKGTNPQAEFVAWAARIRRPSFDWPDSEKPLPAAFRKVWNNYRSKARWRKLPWGLTRSQAWSLHQSKCAFCGAEPQNGSDEAQYSGIDRLDNDQGYTKANCVPACAVCNMAKREMSVDDFVLWAGRVRLHQSTAISQR